MCINIKQVNAITIQDNYLLPITDFVIEQVAGKDAYSFLDGFSGYNQMQMMPQDEEKTSFINNQDLFCYRVMPFGLKNAGTTYQRLVNKMFWE